MKKFSVRLPCKCESDLQRFAWREALSLLLLKNHCNNEINLTIFVSSNDNFAFDLLFLTAQLFSFTFIVCPHSSVFVSSVVVVVVCSVTHQFQL